MNPSKEDKKLGLENLFFFYVGYYYTKNILEELDEHRAEIEAIEISKSLDEKVYKAIREITNNRK